MSALAKLSILTGHEVSGSDAVYGGWFRELSALGADVAVGLRPEKAAAADLTVYTSAIPDDNVELSAARLLGKPVVARNEFLHMHEAMYKKSLAVSGTHGKTTVTALLAHIMHEENTNFTAHIGGKPVDGDNLLFCGKDLFISEACEYKRAFLSLNPDIALILNIECDHPDCYGNEAETVQSFNEFIGKIKPGGTLIINGDTSYEKVCIPAHVKTVTFGLSHMNICKAVNVYERGGSAVFDVLYGDMNIGSIVSPLPGMHNVSNVLAAVCAALCLSVAPDRILQHVHTFKGVERRFEKKCTLNGADIIFDYAHHPSEIAAAIATAKSLCRGKLRVYFQPHTYSRTKSYFNAFTEALSRAPFLGLVKTYPAREAPSDGLNALDLYSAISKNRSVTYFDELLGVSRHIIKTAAPGDISLLLGAGDIYEVHKLF